MAEITVPSGARVVIGEVSLEEALALQDEIDLALLPYNQSCTRAIKSYYAMVAEKIDSGDNTIQFKDIYTLEGLPEMCLAVKSSKRVRDRMFDCLKRSTYNDQKITASTFDDAKARSDYYPIFLACLKENILPFFTFLV